MIKILFFGPVAERVGQREITFAYRPGLRLREVRDELAAHYPQAFEIVAFVAVDGVQARDPDKELTDGAELAFMAKFSGG